MFIPTDLAAISSSLIALKSLPVEELIINIIRTIHISEKAKHSIELLNPGIDFNPYEPLVILSIIGEAMTALMISEKPRVAIAR